MQFKLLLSALIAATAVDAALNEPCIGASGQAGVCVSTSACSASGGTTINGGCPVDAADIKCCTKAPCSGGDNCRWASDCGGSTVANQCPGPSQFKCCTSGSSGFGGHDAPSIPAVGSCKAVAVNGAKAIVDAFPGRVREIGCVRDCGCPGDSDHCCGKATDMMCSDAGGVPTVSGEAIAEWVMNNREGLNLKYVIWGQRIWTPGDAVASWAEWEPMEDRGDVTQNHWDHVHVSYN